jgi:segregation and condensation protein B
MRAAGLLSLDLPADFNVPTPGLAAPEEDPIEDGEEAPEFHMDFLGEVAEGSAGKGDLA